MIQMLKTKRKHCTFELFDISLTRYLTLLPYLMAEPPEIFADTWTLIPRVLHLFFCFFGRPVYVLDKIRRHPLSSALLEIPRMNAALQLASLIN